MPNDRPTDTPPPRAYLSQQDIAEAPTLHLSHPWNEKSEVFMTRLSEPAGLSRLSLAIGRVPPGKESFVYHRHERDEEFLFILSGRGIAEIGEESFEVGPGDFMAFPAPHGPAHHLRNSFEEDLVYLMGGERSGLDVGHFPRLGRRIVFGPSGIFGVEDGDCREMTLDQFFVEKPAG